MSFQLSAVDASELAASIAYFGGVKNASSDAGAASAPERDALAASAFKTAHSIVAATSKSLTQKADSQIAQTAATTTPTNSDKSSAMSEGGASPADEGSAGGEATDGIAGQEEDTAEEWESLPCNISSLRCAGAGWWGGGHIMHKYIWHTMLMLSSGGAYCPCVCPPG